MSVFRLWINLVTRGRDRVSFDHFDFISTTIRNKKKTENFKLHLNKKNAFVPMSKIQSLCNN